MSGTPSRPSAGWSRLAHSGVLLAGPRESQRGVRRGTSGCNATPHGMTRTDPPQPVYRAPFKSPERLRPRSIPAVRDPRLIGTADVTQPSHSTQAIHYALVSGESVTHFEFEMLYLGERDGTFVTTSAQVEAEFTAFVKPTAAIDRSISSKSARRRVARREPASRFTRPCLVSWPFHTEIPRVKTWGLLRGASRVAPSSSSSCRGSDLGDVSSWGTVAWRATSHGREGTRAQCFSR